MDIYALDGTVDAERWEVPVKVGQMSVVQVRFDAAMNLLGSAWPVADSHSEFALELMELLEPGDGSGELADGMYRDTILIEGIQIREDLRFSGVLEDSVKVALIGMSGGISRAFLLLEPELLANPKALNAETMRYAALGFRPVALGSNLLWINLEAKAFWEK